MDSQFTAGAHFGAASTPKRPPLRVLLADDEPLVLQVTTLILHRSSYAVTQVRSGEEALAILQLESFDLIVTDFRMAGKSGADVAIAARQDHPHTPVVLMTGRIDDVPEWMRLGALALPIVLKPFLMVELLQTVNRAMRARKSA
jgi:CheY-like chemotaxis protein